MLTKTLRLLSGQGAREGYLAASDQAIISLANFLATIILARNVSLTELGVYGVGFTILRLVRSVQEGLTIQPVNALGPGMDEAQFRRYVSSTSLIQLALAAVSAATIALLGMLLTQTGNDTLGPTIFSLWPAFFFWQLQEYLRRVMYARGQIFYAMLNSALANAVRMGVMLYWADQGTLTGPGGLLAIAIGSLVALLPGAWQTRDCWTRHFEPLAATWQRNWRFGRWVLGGTIASWVSVEFYPVLTAGMVSFAAAGAYRALQNLVAPVLLLLRATDSFLTPRAARIYRVSGLPGVNQVMRLTYLITSLPVLGLLALAVIFREQIIAALYGDEYLVYSNGMFLMALFYALLYLYSPVQSALKAVQVSRPIFVANLLAILAMFAVGIWMIYAWGLYGTISGQALNALIVNLVLWAAWLSLRQTQD
jgi:O-antigen/teichoic acid export membrane protein